MLLMRFSNCFHKCTNVTPAAKTYLTKLDCMKIFCLTRIYFPNHPLVSLHLATPTIHSTKPQHRQPLDQKVRVMPCTLACTQVNTLFLASSSPKSFCTSNQRESQSCGNIDTNSLLLQLAITSQLSAWQALSALGLAQCQNKNIEHTNTLILATVLDSSLSQNPRD